MYILIDEKIGAVELAEPNDVHRFHIAIAHGTSDDSAERILESRAIGRLDPDDDDHAWVLAGRVRELADGRVGPRWAQEFEKMLAHGAKHGWYDAGSGEIKAHVEWLVEEEELGSDPSTVLPS